MTDLVYTFLKNGNLKTHFYNYKQSKPTLEEFNEVYCKYSLSHIMRKLLNGYGT